MAESQGPAPSPFLPPVPKKAPLKYDLMRCPCELPRHYRSSSLDRGQRTFYLNHRPDHFSIASEHSLIPETEPEVIEKLWGHIREDLGRCRSLHEGKIPVRNIGGCDKRILESEQDGITKSRSGAPSETSYLLHRTQTSDPSTENTSPASAYTWEASPDDEDFGEQVLEPRGISIVGAYDISVWDHFCTEEPDRDRISFYRDKGSKHSAVWLNADRAFCEEVANEYHCMLEANMCEAEFASYAKEVLFHRDQRVSYREFGDLRGWKTDRMLELDAKANVNSFKCWDSPPVLKSDRSLKEYDFDIRPDCAYWLSLQAFDGDYVTKVRAWAVIIKDRATCPYLFIEFKKDDKDSSSAYNKVAAAASLALYNRFNLRTRAEQAGESPEQIPIGNIKNYGITFQGPSFVVWCIQPKLRESAGEWAGCTMTSLRHGRCNYKSDVKALTDWINEIHRWGLSVHGPSCENDIKICISKRSISRVSDVHESLE